MSVLQDSELERLYQLSKHHLSELSFLDDETKFLQSLLDKYFPSMIQDIHINRIQLISSQLTQIIQVKTHISNDALLHQANLQSTIKGLNVKSIDFLKLEDERIEDEVKQNIKFLRNIKKEIFTIYKDQHPSED